MTSDSMLPMLRQMLDADGDAVRAGIMLSAPTRILLRWRVEFEKYCRKARFDEGADYLALLDASADATRIDGLLPPRLQLSLETARQRLVLVAEGGQSAVGSRGSEEPPTGVEDGSLDRLPTADCRLPGDDPSRLAALAPQDEGGGAS